MTRNENFYAGLLAGVVIGMLAGIIIVGDVTDAPDRAQSPDTIYQANGSLLVFSANDTVFIKIKTVPEPVTGRP
mgnify:CR=1 FL=1